MAGFLGDWDFTWRLRVGCWNWLIQIWWKERGDPFVCRYLPTYPYPWLISAQAHIPSGLKVCFWTCCGKSALQIWLVNLEIALSPGSATSLLAQVWDSQVQWWRPLPCLFHNRKWFLPTLSGARGGGSWASSSQSTLGWLIYRRYHFSALLLGHPHWGPSFLPFIVHIKCWKHQNTGLPRPTQRTVCFRHTSLLATLILRP